MTVANDNYKEREGVRWYSWVGTENTPFKY
jgi:hypothetical protein